MSRIPNDDLLARDGIHCPICGSHLPAPGAACTNCEGVREFETPAVSGAELARADDDYAVRVRRTVHNRVRRIAR